MEKIEEEPASLLYDNTKKAVIDAGLELKKNEWSAYDIVISTDEVRQWAELPEAKRHFLTLILVFFAAADGLVNNNLKKFIDRITCQTVQGYFLNQASGEVTHQQAYRRLIDTFLGPSRIADVLEMLKSTPAIAKKIEWSQKWFGDPACPLGHALFANVILEGIFFRSSFCGIRRLELDRVCQSIPKFNEYIMLEEDLHMKNGAMIFATYIEKTRPSTETAHAMVDEAVAIEEDFFRTCAAMGYKDISEEEIARYIRFEANRVLVLSGYERLYDVPDTCPLEIMNRADLVRSDDFQARRSTEYMLGLVGRTDVGVNW